MRAVITPGGVVTGTARVPGDKSIAHRWIILAATSTGRSELRGLPPSLDVGSTARVVAGLFPRGTAALRAWGARVEDDGRFDGAEPDTGRGVVECRGPGRAGLG